MSPRLLIATLATISALATLPAHAVDATLQLDLAAQSGDFQKHDVLYDCSEGEPFTVVYLNASPNFLALVPLADEPQSRVFASIVSDAGVRYASGQWVWETDGTDARLLDTTLDAAAPPVLTCSELVNTP